jgi:spore germination cell wall hydrolase CwlJ-like protein
MKMKILALLLSVALISAAGAAQARNDSNFRASAEAVAEVQNNGALPPTAARADVAARLAAWKRTFKTMVDPNTVAKSCLAQAVYFEARSESVLGQLAVATVILNRAKAENYPSSICGVVYQGASHLNACQFSFACDEQSNLPQNDRAWETALAVTAMALSDDKPVGSVAAATFYHADYVTPYWSKSMNRLAKIGRHIFYSQG